MPPKPKVQLTHFLLLPLVTPTSRPQLQSSIQRFAAEVTTPNGSGEATTLPTKAIRPVGSIHLTIGVMSLLTPERVDDACKYLKSLDIHEMLRAASNPPPPPPAKAVDNNIPGSIPQPPSSAVLSLEPKLPPTPLLPSDGPASPSPPPLTLTLSGLHTHRSPKRTSNLHATPIPDPSSSHLHPFATHLQKAFTSAGFLLPETRPLTLHATLVNTIYPPRVTMSGKNRWGKGSGKFDATGLMERFRGVVWARDVRVEKVAICEMGLVDVVEGEGEGQGQGQGQGRERDGTEGDEKEGKEKIVNKVYKEIASVDLP